MVKQWVTDLHRQVLIREQGSLHRETADQRHFQPFLYFSNTHTHTLLDGLLKLRPDSNSIAYTTIRLYSLFYSCGKGSQYWRKAVASSS